MVRPMHLGACAGTFLQHTIAKWPVYVFLLSGATCLFFR